MSVSWLRLTSSLSIAPTLRRAMSSSRWMMRVMRAACSAMMSAFLVTASALSDFLAIVRARPAMTLSGVPTSCAISAAIWPIVASFSVWNSRSSSLQLGLVLPLGLGAGLAQRVGHVVEPRGQRADLVLALAQEDARQVALRDVVDAGQELGDRSGDERPGRQHDRHDDEPDDQEQDRQGVHAGPSAAALVSSVSGRADLERADHGEAVGLAGRQLGGAAA